MTDKRDPGLEGWPDPASKPPRPPRTTMTDWQKFALLIFAIVAIGVVWLVYNNIAAGIARM